MALANFFDKSALAAAEILRGYDRDQFERELLAHPIGVAFDDQAASSAEGSGTLEVAVDLLARLYPRLAIAAYGAGAAALAAKLTEHARNVNPEIELSDDLAHVEVGLVVGQETPSCAGRMLYLGSNGWVARFSPHHPIGSGSTQNPFGAGAAACFGVANVFRFIFAGQLPDSRLDEELSLSLLDLKPNAGEPFNPPLVGIDLGEAFLIGLGAIGNGAVWALSRVPSLRGVLHLIDPEVVALSNLQRYLLAEQCDVGREKVEIAAESLRAVHDLDVHRHRLTWGAYLRERHNWNLPCVAVAVDSAEVRQSIQAALPRWIINAWTQPADLGVSRHGFLGAQACLACLYLPDGERPHTSQLVAQAVGLPHLEPQIRQLLYTGEPVGRPLIEQIADALKVNAEALLVFADRPISAFYSDVICGGVVLALGGAPHLAGGVQVPMAFQSALAGLLLAAGLVAHAGRLGPEQPTKTSIDLMRPIARVLSEPHRTPSVARCICQDTDYITAYRAKYGS